MVRTMVTEVIDHGAAYQVKSTKSGKEQKLSYERVTMPIK